MSVLCQIALVESENKFQEYIEQYNHPPNGYAGWGRFYGEVPAIGTTLQVDWCDYESVNGIALPEGHKNDRERASDKFKVIHHHRHLVPKPEFYSGSTSDEIKLAPNVGHHAVVLCVIYVVAA